MGVITGLLPEYWSFVVARLVIGVTTSGVFLVSYVLAMEMVGPSHRVIAGTLCQYYYTFGFLLMALVAYLISDVADWRTLQIAFSAPAVLFLPYWWLMPESVRWLIRRGRHEEARAVVGKVARANGRSEAQAAAAFEQLIAALKQEQATKY